MVKGSPGGQGLNGWPIHFLEIRKMKMMLYRYLNICLPYLDSLDPKLIPTDYQSMHIAGQRQMSICLFVPGPYLTHALFVGPDLTHIPPIQKGLILS